MTTQQTNSQTVACKNCGRALDDRNKFGLCDDCTNKFGTPIIAAGTFVFGVAVRKLGPKALKIVRSLIKR